MQQSQPQQAHEARAAGLMLDVGEFKGINVDYWINYAVMQVLNSQLEDSSKYVLAVENLQSVMIRDAKERRAFDLVVNDEHERLKNAIGSADEFKTQVLTELARWKFGELMARIEHKREKLVEVNL